MTTNHQWLYAGTEPLLSDMLSDPATRDLMRADGVSVEDVNAIVDRVRRNIRPLEFVPRGQPVALTAKFSRRRPIHGADHKANMHAAAGVIDRWISAIGADIAHLR